MRKASQHHVIELVQLRHQRSLDVRVAVAKQVDPPRADAVKVATAFKVMEPYTFGF